MILRSILFLILAMILVPSAKADDMRPGYLEVKETAPLRYAVHWKAPTNVRNVVPGFPSDCRRISEPQRSFEAAALISKWDMVCDQSLSGRSVVLDGLNNSQGDALLRFQSATGSMQVERLIPANPSVVIDLKPERTQVAKSYFVIGIEHILMGYDHLLFVLCLVLLLNGAWRVAATVTAFTIAHSLTLVATTLGWFALPRAPVEAAIALSIVFLAVEVIKRDPSQPRLSERMPWVIAFLFGLLHGFGFAGALAEIGLPQGDVPTALIAFNLGVEAGQLAIVGLALTALAAVRWIRSNLLAPTRTVAGYAIGSIAAMWLIERVSGA